MDKKKGLADSGDGEFILNESGTSVSISTENEHVETNEKTKPGEGDQKGSSGPEEKDITD